MPDLPGRGHCPPQRCQWAGHPRHHHLDPPRRARTRCVTRAPAAPDWPLHLATAGPCTSGPVRPGPGGEVAAWTLPGARRGSRRHRGGMGGGREAERGSGLAATPTSYNHSQALECTAETGEIYLLIVGICGQWVFLMKTICFCVFPENIIPWGKWYSHPFQQYPKKKICVYRYVHIHAGVYP